MRQTAELAFVFILVFLFMESSWADVYKCSVDGKIVYSQSPCSPDAQRVEVKTDRSRPEDAVQAEERLRKFREQQEKDSRRIDIETAIIARRRELARLQTALDHEIEALQLEQSRANNNLAGATYRESLAIEMTAITGRYRSSMDSVQRDLDRLQDQLSQIR